MESRRTSKMENQVVTRENGKWLRINEEVFNRV